MQTSKNILDLRSALFVFVAAGFLFFSGCHVTVEPEPGQIDTNTPVTFSRIQREIFTPHCALSGCHSGSDAQAGMNLSAGAAYTNLVSVQSSGSGSLKRVEPGNSANSFLVQRMRNIGESPSIMPPAGKLSENQIQLVEIWIANGAKND